MKMLLIVGLTVATVSLMILYLDITSAAFSLGVNFALMFWFTLFESQLKPKLNSTYFNSQPFEKQGKWYKKLGVEGYRTILTKIGWEKMRQQQTPIKKDLRAFQVYERASRVAEVGHLVIGGIVLIITTYVILMYSIKDALWLILFNLVLNIYPILLQRYTRPRLQRMIKKFEVTELTSV